MEKYSPVSTANRSPITRQKAIWGHSGKSGEMDGTAGPKGEAEREKMAAGKAEICIYSQVPVGKPL